VKFIRELVHESGAVNVNVNVNRAGAGRCQDFLLLYDRLLTQFNHAVTSSRHLLVILQYVVNDLRLNTNVIDAEIDGALADVNRRADELEKQGQARREEPHTTDVNTHSVFHITDSSKHEQYSDFVAMTFRPLTRDIRSFSSDEGLR